MKSNRFLELEGLRGVAAVVVAAYHFLLAFYLFSFLGPRSPMVSAQNNFIEDNLYGNPIMVFLSGTFAVAIFFVLSGFVLSIGFFTIKKTEIIKKMAAKRYLRLMIPALASIMLCFLALLLGLGHIQEVAALTHSGWLAETWTFNPDFLAAVKGGVIDIFTVSGNSYNNVLWTMQIEFVGSFIVFGFLMLFGKVKYRFIIYIFLGILTFNTWFIGFIAGMAMADLFASGVLKQKKRHWYALLAVPLALFFGGYPVGGAEGTIYAYITNFNADINWLTLYLTVAAVLLIGSVLCISQVAKIFRWKPLSILGKYTFSLYLVHLIVLYTVTTSLFLILRNQLGLGFNTSVIISIVLSIPVLAAATILFEKYIDAPAIRFASYYGNVLLGYQKLPIRFTRILKRIKKRVSGIVRQTTTKSIIREEVEDL